MFKDCTISIDTINTIIPNQVIQDYLGYQSIDSVKKNQFRTILAPNRYLPFYNTYLPLYKDCSSSQLKPAQPAQPAKQANSMSSSKSDSSSSSSSNQHKTYSPTQSMANPGMNYWVRSASPTQSTRRNAAGRGLFSGLQDTKHYNVDSGWAGRQVVEDGANSQSWPVLGWWAGYVCLFFSCSFFLIEESRADALVISGFFLVENKWCEDLNRR